MTLKQVIDLVSAEKVRVHHNWEFYPNHMTSEVKDFWIDEIPEWLLSMPVTTIFAENDNININVKKSNKLIFGSKYCYCYKSVIDFLDSIDKFLD